MQLKDVGQQQSQLKPAKGRLGQDQWSLTETKTSDKPDIAQYVRKGQRQKHM